MQRRNGDEARAAGVRIGRMVLALVCSGVLLAACGSSGAGAGSAAAPAGSGSAGSAPAGSTSAGSAAVESGSGGIGPGGSAPAGSASAASGGSGGGGSGAAAPVKLPASCKTILHLVNQDLGVKLALVDAKTKKATELDCNFFESSEAKDNGAGYISTSWGVMDTAQMASVTFDTVSGMSFGNEKSSKVPDLGDEAVVVTDDGVVVQVNVLSGRSIVTVSQLQYDTPIPLAKWTALAKDLLAGKA